MKDKLKTLSIKSIKYLIIIALTITVIHLVRVNYIYIGFINKADYKDLLSVQGELSACNAENYQLHDTIQKDNYQALK